MKKAPKVPTEGQFKSLLKKVGKLDDDVMIFSDADAMKTGSWAGLSKRQKIKIFKFYQDRLSQQNSNRVFNKDGSPNFD